MEQGHTISKDGQNFLQIYVTINFSFEDTLQLALHVNPQQQEQLKRILTDYITHIQNWFSGSMPKTKECKNYQRCWFAAYFFFVGPIELLLQVLYILVGSRTSEMIAVKPNCVVFDHQQARFLGILKIRFIIFSFFGT